MSTNPRYKILAPFFSELHDCFEPVVSITAGQDCLRRVVDCHVRNGYGSLSVLDRAIDPNLLDWPVAEKVCLIEWPGVDLNRYVDFEKILLRCGSPLIAGYVEGELRLRRGWYE